MVVCQAALSGQGGCGRESKQNKGRPTRCSAAVFNIDWQPGTPIAASERWPMSNRIETELL